MLIDLTNIGREYKSPLNILWVKLRAKDIEPEISKPVFEKIFNQNRNPIRNSVIDSLVEENFLISDLDSELP